LWWMLVAPARMSMSMIVPIAMYRLKPHDDDGYHHVPSCAFACASVEGGDADSGSPDGASDSAGTGGTVASGGKGDAGNDPGLGVPSVGSGTYATN